MTKLVGKAKQRARRRAAAQRRAKHAPRPKPRVLDAALLTGDLLLRQAAEAKERETREQEREDGHG
jgi:hypothetical protein